MQRTLTNFVAAKGALLVLTLGEELSESYHFYRMAIVARKSYFWQAFTGPSA